MTFTPMRSVGVTASRSGLSEVQRTILRGTLQYLRDRWGATELHHGDCVGGDEEAANIAKELGYITHAHPPVLDHLRAHHASDFVYPDKDYLVRDREIVDVSDVLLGFPSGNTETVRSGTWYTIRYARSLARNRIVTGPDGRTLEVTGFSYGAAS